MSSARNRSSFLKIRKLEKIISSLKRVVVAYSGGVDSSYLLYFSQRVLGSKNVLAVIAESPTYPTAEIKSAIKICKALKVNYQVVKTKEMEDENFLCNSRDRCYYCKKELFTKLRMIALENNFENVVDGSNYDDLFDFRPGSWAKSELGVRSPLQEAGLTKEEIRRFSQLADLPTWDRPPMACLASRIPYGTKITSQILWQVGKAEKFLKSLGFRQVRVRHHGDLARIEVGEVEIDKVLEQKRREKIVKELEKLGYLFVSLDLKGYRSGSLNLIRQ